MGRNTCFQFVSILFHSFMATCPVFYIFFLLELSYEYCPYFLQKYFICLGYVLIFGFYFVYLSYIFFADLTSGIHCVLYCLFTLISFFVPIGVALNLSLLLFNPTHMFIFVLVLLTVYSFLFTRLESTNRIFVSTLMFKAFQLFSNRKYLVYFLPTPDRILSYYFMYVIFGNFCLDSWPISFNILCMTFMSTVPL